MADFGVVPAGFAAKALDDIKADIEGALQQVFGQSIDLSPQSNFGQLVGVLSERYAECWDVMEMIYAAFTPDGATGAALDALCGITGTTRIPAASSTVDLTCTGTAGTVLNAGREVSTQTVGTKFVTTVDGTIAAASAWATSHAYSSGALVKNSGNVYLCITGGTSASSGGPTTTAADITDGTAHWEYLGAGSGVVSIPAESLDAGPQVALAGTLTVIDTGVAGWSNVTNLLDAALGRNLETDADLRIRREQELRATGKASVEAIREALLNVAGVTAATVFENPTDSTDSDSLPPHSIECLVQLSGDPINQDVLNCIWANKAAGIATYGGSTGSVVDSEGVSHVVSYSTPTAVPIYVAVHCTYDATLYPVDGDTQVQEAITAFGASAPAGLDSVSSRLKAQVFKVPGMLDVTALYIKTSATPTLETTIAISKRQIATYDTSRIAVTSTPGTP